MSSAQLSSPDHQAEQCTSLHKHTPALHAAAVLAKTNMHTLSPCSSTPVADKVSMAMKPGSLLVACTAVHRTGVNAQARLDREL